MKKTALFLLTVILITTMFSGCESGNEKPSVSPDTSNSETTATQDENEIINGISVKAKKYDFKGNNVLILDTENTADKNYTVSVAVTYYDENKSPVKEETETFEGYAAGYQKYFLFNPEIAFDSYDYNITVEEYDGDCYASYIDIKFNNISIFTNLSGKTNVMADTGMGNSYSENLRLEVTCVTFDSTGNIKLLNDPAKIVVIFAGTTTIDSKPCMLTPPENIEYPTDFLDGCSVIYVVNSVEIEQES